MTRIVNFEEALELLNEYQQLIEKANLKDK